jgi:hypothetical protein
LYIQGTLIKKEAVQQLGLKATKDTKVRSFKTGAGKFKTTHKKVRIQKQRILSLNSKCSILQGLFAKVQQEIYLEDMILL